MAFRTEERCDYQHSPPEKKTLNQKLTKPHTQTNKNKIEKTPRTNTNPKHERTMVVETNMYVHLSLNMSSRMKVPNLYCTFQYKHFTLYLWKENVRFWSLWLNSLCIMYSVCLKWLPVFKDSWQTGSPLSQLKTGSFTVELTLLFTLKIVAYKIYGQNLNLESKYCCA